MAIAYGSHEERTLRAKASRLVTLAKYRARTKGLDFELDREWAYEELKRGTCSFSGIPFSYDRHPQHRTHPWAPSIHRKDSNAGYTKSNSTLVATGVNKAINNFTTQEFLLLAMAVLKKHNLH